MFFHIIWEWNEAFNFYKCKYLTIFSLTLYLARSNSVNKIVNIRHVGEIIENHENNTQRLAAFTSFASSIIITIASEW